MKGHRAPAALFLCLSIFVIATQNEKVGFEPGHHGWVTSHTLAIIGHAAPENGWVGYVFQLKDQQGKISYEYFDRSPVFFSALMNLLVESPARSLHQKVYLARQIMNFIFLAALLIGFFLLRDLLGDALTAMSATLLTFSGYYYMYYKDMVHFDQAALLGFLLLLYAILRYRRTRRRGLLYLAAVFAVSFGRGYVSVALAGLWSGIELMAALRANHFKPLTAARLWIRTEAFKIMSLCLLLGACYFGYNLSMEARLRGVSWRDTGVVDSAMRRSGLKRRTVQPRTRDRDWNVYIPMMARRLVKSAVPYAVWTSAETGDKDTFKRSLLAVAVIGFGAPVIILYFRRAPFADRSFYILLMLSGFAWFVPMRHHTAMHDYVAIYFAGLVMVIFTAALARIPAKLRVAGLLIALAVFAASNLSVNADHSRVAASANAYTHDFETILDKLHPQDNVYADGGHRNFLYNRRYALGFYLGAQYITPAAIADYAISSNRDFAPQTLTPQNHAVFLFRINQGRESSHSAK